MNQLTYGIIENDGELIEYPVVNQSVKSPVECGHLVQICNQDGVEVVKLFSTKGKELLWSEQNYTFGADILRRITEKQWYILLAIREHHVRLQIIRNHSFSLFLNKVSVGSVVTVPGRAVNEWNKEYKCTVKYVGPVPAIGPGTFFGFEFCDEHMTIPYRNNLPMKLFNVNNRRGFIRAADSLLHKVHRRNHGFVEDDRNSNQSGDNPIQQTTQARTTNDNYRSFQGHPPTNQIDEIEQLRLKVEMLEKLVAEKHSTSPQRNDNDREDMIDQRKKLDSVMPTNRRNFQHRGASKGAGPYKNRDFHSKIHQSKPITPQNINFVQPKREHHVERVASSTLTQDELEMLQMLEKIKLIEEQEKIKQLKFNMEAMKPKSGFNYVNQPPLIPTPAKVNVAVTTVTSSTTYSNSSPMHTNRISQTTTTVTKSIPSSSSYSIVPPRTTAVLNLYEGETQDAELHWNAQKTHTNQSKPATSQTKSEIPPKPSAGFFKNLFNFK